VSEMSYYEATYKKDWVFNGRPVTYRDYCAKCINTEWVYSMYWDEKHWIECALTDAKHRLAQVDTDARRLNNIINTLGEMQK